MRVLVWCMVAWVSVMAHPRVTVTVSEAMPKQGDVVWVHVKSPQPIRSGSIHFNNKVFTMFTQLTPDEEGMYRAISCIGVSRYMVPKQTQMRVAVTFDDGSTHRTRTDMQVRSAGFKKEYIQLTPKKYSLSQNKPKRSNENQILGKGFRTITAKRQYDGAFIWPTKGRFSSEFGVQRVYNNRPGWAHAGIDIAAVKGTSVVASQRGTIMLAERFAVHGNTVLIDHGWGIITVYNHLDELRTTTGAVVDVGEEIGTVGSTGVATGDHLHFGVSVQNVRVEPRGFVDGVRD